MRRLTHTSRQVAVAVAMIVAGLGAGRAPAAHANGGQFTVAPWGSDASAGSASSPFRTIARAVSAAASGSTITVRGGRYHESVQIYGKGIRITAAAGEQVSLDGSRPVTGWGASGGDWWAPWAFVASRTTSAPVDPAVPLAGWADQMFRDGILLREVGSRTSVVPGTFYVDQAARLVWVGDNPSGHTIEGSDLPWALYFNRANGSSLNGVTVRRFATGASNMAAVRAYCDDVVITNSRFEWNAYSGLSVMGRRIRVSSSRSVGNGFIGIHGLNTTTFTLENSLVERNNREHFNPKDSASGVKLTASSGLRFTGNVVRSNQGPGIWTDNGSSYVKVIGNLVEGNLRSGIQIELSGQAVVAGNVSLGNGEAGVWVLESNDVRVWNNAAFGNHREIWVEEGPRTSSTANAVVNWDLNRVTLRNNVIGQGAAGVQALLNVDDWTEKRSATDMKVTSDYTWFWLPASSATDNLARWARWSAPLAINTTLPGIRSSTAQESHSVMSAAGSNPYVRSVASKDYRVPASVGRGAVPPTDIAVLLGVPAGVAIAPGPTRPSPILV